LREERLAETTWLHKQPGVSLQEAPLAIWKRWLLWGSAEDSCYVSPTGLRARRAVRATDGGRGSSRDGL